MLDSGFVVMDVLYVSMYVVMSREWLRWVVKWDGKGMMVFGVNGDLYVVKNKIIVIYVKFCVLLVGWVGCVGY